ncbi:MAG: hypothetical protein J7K31_02525 [Candidatus Aenigmarchaeota archaeon]|nr:hypothetical protein [Candidatus Aenigmarchaeota archaeon]
MSKSLRLYLAVSFGFLMLAILSIPTPATEVNVDITGKIEGYPEYLYFDNITNGTYEHIYTEWMNSGSVSCKVKIRADILKDDAVVYTGWSQEKIMLPGAYDTFDIYWLPKEDGNYHVVLTAYQCYESKKIKEINFSAIGTNKTRASLEDIAGISISNTKDMIRINVKKKRGVESLPPLVVIPSQYPMGWYFESKKLEPTQDKIIDTISYYAEYWKEEPITLEIVSEDGKYYAKKTIRLKEPRDVTPLYAVVGFVIGVIVVKKLNKRPKRRD